MSELRLLPILISFCGIYVFKSAEAHAQTFKFGQSQVEFQSKKDSRQSDVKSPIAPAPVEFLEPATFPAAILSPSFAREVFISPLAAQYKIRAGLSPPARAAIA